MTLNGVIAVILCPPYCPRLFDAPYSWVSSSVFIQFARTTYTASLLLYFLLQSV